MRSVSSFVRWAVLGVLVTGRAGAQELFLRSWNAEDGLAHGRVNAMLEDGHGYLWVATWEGVSRFDGRSFENYGAADGLGAALVFALAVDPGGDLWAAPFTRGVARFVEQPHAGAGRFQAFPIAADEGADNVDALLFDELGMWVGTDAGVYRARSRAEPRFERVWTPAARPWSLQAFLTAGGRGWIVGADEVLELVGDGVRVHRGPGGARPRDSVNAQPTPDGRALIVTTAGLFVFDGQAAARGEPCWSALSTRLAADEVIHATAIDARGRILLATIHGLLWLDGESHRRITSEQGLPDEWLRNLAFDRAGTLWIGSNLGGLTCLREPTVQSYRGARRERLTLVGVHCAPQGTVYVTAEDHGLLRLEGGALVGLAGCTEPFLNVRLLPDADGGGWLGGAAGIWRVPGPELDLARARLFPLADGVGSAGELHREPSGRILVGGFDGALHALEPGADALRRLVPSAAFDGVFPRGFVRGPDGTLWIATNEALYRARGERVERVEPEGEITSAQLAPRELLLDARGTLWVGTRRAGLAWTRDPSRARPSFRRLAMGDGLPSDHVLALAEDGQGRLWIGTGRGLARFDPADESLRLLTSADGLAGEVVNDLCCGRDGTLWAAVAGGLSHLDPRVEPQPSPPPPVRIRRFEAGGRAFAVPQSGAERLTGLELAPAERSIAIAFTGIDLVNGERLRFQHRLEGLEADWSEASQETSASYGSLAPGRYRFLVRARAHDGVASAAPAAVEFRLAAPFWRRAWFPPLVLALAGLAAFAVQRLRAQRLRALARIRGQIATDLHDEVGSSLAQIAVLAEVARREGPAEAGERLRQVAELARATRGSMADLVWAIDPLRDTLQDLLQRLRTVTANLLGAEGIELVLDVPGEAELDGLALAPDQRRQLLFFFKEAVHNVARHARARRVEIELALEPDRLRLAVRDDGQGFDPRAPAAGQGLASLRRRAHALGGEMRLESRPGGGTRIELSVPR